jgi:predicted RNA-binding Zn-ribbon protein involved in translation (DUF1610 family)
MIAAESYAAARRDQRRRMLVFKTIQIAFFPIILSAAFLSLSRSLPRQWLNRFRCPRCGNLYYWRLQWQGYMDRQKKWRDCRHCGLAQDRNRASQPNSFFLPPHSAYGAVGRGSSGPWAD